MNKQDLIDTIIASEWEMFHDINNINGKASCQNDPTTFKIMRQSQAISWSVPALESYLDDLINAKQDGRNLLTEKYARMMKITSPLEYERIEHLLPPLDQSIVPIIDEIVEMMITWEIEFAQRYPTVTRRLRPVSSVDDQSFVTSLDTYIRGELETYSSKTLDLYHKHLCQQKSINVNVVEVILEYTVQQYGYSSLQDADQKFQV